MNLSRQFMAFCLIGVVNSTIHYVVFLFLFRVLGGPMLPASGLAYGCGLLNSYFMNRHWTFRSVQRRSISEFARFTLVNVVALATNLVGLQVLVDRGGWRPELAQIVAIGASLVINFAGNRWWTFRLGRG